MKAIIRYSLGRTINTGNYENAKVEVALELECQEEDVKQTFYRVKRFVTKKSKRMK